MLIEIILGEIIVLLALIIVFFIILIWQWLRKIVVVPELTVATDKTSYRRAETVTISGTLQSNGSPISGEAVALAIQPPTGDAYSLPQATTDGDGNFSVNWDVPSDAVAGEYTVTATAMGISATTTFTLSIAFE